MLLGVYKCLLECLALGSREHLSSGVYALKRIWVDCMKSMVWFGLVWFGLVWFGLVWFGLAWLGLVWLGLVWFGLAWFGLVWFGLVWFGLVWSIQSNSSILYSPCVCIR